MFSLFKVQFNWASYFIIGIAIRMLFIDISWLSFFAVMISLHQFLILFYSIGSVLPIRYLAGAFMCLQMLLGPTFAYNGLDQYQRMYYQMQIPEVTYFSYAIPAVILFIVGLHVTAGKLKGEVVDQNKIKTFVGENPRLPYIFVATGFVSSLIAGSFGAELGFVFVLLGCFKFIGAFLLILGNKKIKPVTLVLIYGAIISSSLAKAMFHDLLIWVLFLGAVLSLRYKPDIKFKALMATVFILAAIFVQLIKGDYRKAAWSGETGGIDLLNETIESKEQGNEAGLFNKESLAKSNIRINQGFIVTNIMKTVPEKVPFQNGEQMLLIVESAVLPRILAPNKLNAGDRQIFMTYSGIPIQKGTSMGLSSLGDAYINFGTLGGAIFMFFYGLLFSTVLNLFGKYSRFYPILMVITPLVFYYPIRPDCELQTILGHIVKSCFLIFVIIEIWKYKFSRRSPNHAITNPPSSQ